MNNKCVIALESIDPCSLALLEQTIAEFSTKSEARLNRLDDAVVGIEYILQQLIRRDQNGNGNNHGCEERLRRLNPWFS